MMKNKKWVIGMGLMVSVLVVAWLRREVQIDKSLDAGGAWDYVQQSCHFDVSQK
jgi:hypothetical protein